jgi:hypothetical protein
LRNGISGGRGGGVNIERNDTNALRTDCKDNEYFFGVLLRKWLSSCRGNKNSEQNNKNALKTERSYMNTLITDNNKDN